MTYIVNLMSIDMKLGLDGNGCQLNKATTPTPVRCRRSPSSTKATDDVVSQASRLYYLAEKMWGR